MFRRKCLTLLCAAASLSLVALLGNSASAAQVTYLRFDDDLNAAADSTVTPLPSHAVIDASGGDDDFAAFATGNAPTYRSDVPVGTVPQNGFTNSLSIDTSGGKDVYAVEEGPLRTTAFTAFTVEAWVKFDVLTGFQTIVGRDDSGNPGLLAGGRALFYLQKSNTNFLRFEAANANGDYVAIADTVPVLADQWYHVAITGDGTNATLYKDGQSVGTAAFAGGLYDPDPNTIWTVGRGQFNGGTADFVSGLIDEVRWSDTALAPSQFLNVPEPSGLGLLLAGGMLILRRKRRA